jgi:2'-hydroxyisoflavone reductase
VRILILGGTRFLGRQVAIILAAVGHELTLLSRRHTDVPSGARQICAERSTGLTILQGSCFDLVLDFICYQSSDLDQLMASISTKRYILISSTWLPRLWSGTRADELITDPTHVASELPDVTLNYLSGKLSVEQALTRLRETGCVAVSLRLPIMLGEGDHTGRFDFYRSRLADGGPLILVDGGENLAQIAVMEDLAQAIARWCIDVDICRFPVWEALPGEGRSIRCIIELMADTAGMTVDLVGVPVAELSRDLSEYLEQEPFWRESSLPVTAANIYSAVGMLPTVFGETFVVPALSDNAKSGLRSKELLFLAKRHVD